jgi:hypothetical protein
MQYGYNRVVECVKLMNVYKIIYTYILLYVRIRTENTI